LIQYFSKFIAMLDLGVHHNEEVDICDNPRQMTNDISRRSIPSYYRHEAPTLHAEYA
jgi:hypothetical protein